MKTPLVLENWGLCDYPTAFERQTKMLTEHLQGNGTDTLVLVEHPASVTLGRRGCAADLRLPEADLTRHGISMHNINRGGLATAHEPGQLVVYPVIALKRKDLHWFSKTFLGVVITLLSDYGLTGVLKDGEPGVWVNNRKICSFGIALKKWVSSHGIALNVNNDLKTFDMIIPCGQPTEVVTSMRKELGQKLDLAALKKRFAEHFSTAFNYELREDSNGGRR